MIFCSLVWFFQCCGDYSCLGYASLECCLSSIILLYTMNISIHTNIYIHLLYYLLSCFSLLPHAHARRTKMCSILWTWTRAWGERKRTKTKQRLHFLSILYIKIDMYTYICMCLWRQRCVFNSCTHNIRSVCAVLGVRGWKTVAKPRSTHRVIHSIHRIICG